MNDGSGWQGNGWTQYQKLVLAELERHSDTLESLEKHLNRVEIEIATLKIRASIWGALGASIPAIGIVLFELLKK